MDFQVQNAIIAGGITTSAALLPVYNASFLEGVMINPNVTNLRDGNYLAIVPRCVF